MHDIIQRFKDKSATIGVIGLGYVGLPLSICYKKEGYHVLGFDVDQSKVDLLQAKQTYIKHIDAGIVADAIDHGFEPTSDFSRISEADALIICVPTPLNKYREPDLSYVIQTMEMISPYLKENQVLSLESTTYPGTTEEEIVTRVESRGFSVGDNFFVVYSPEREDPGNQSFGTQDIPKILGGHTEACLAAGIALYDEVIHSVVPVSSTKTAEMVKLLENIHRSVNIGLVNEMKKVADKMGIDIHEVVSAAATKPFGFTPYYPGPGVGGHCIPIDPFYLTWKAREHGVHTRFIELAGEINCSMPDYVVQKLADALNIRGKSIKGSKILVLGISYKKNVDDCRESPSVHIMEILRSKEADLDYSDPYWPSFPSMRDHQFDLDSVTLDASTLASYDAVVLATSHDVFDYQLIEDHASLIIDTRGKYRKEMENLVRA